MEKKIIAAPRRDIEIIGNEQPAQTAKVAYANGQPNDAVEPV